jgi:hypothetical protein
LFINDEYTAVYLVTPHRPRTIGLGFGYKAENRTTATCGTFSIVNNCRSRDRESVAIDRRRGFVHRKVLTRKRPPPI